MPRTKKEPETEMQRRHGHCADVFISDFGIPKDMREAICQEIDKVWKQNTMIHCLIISSVRGFQPHSATRGLQYFLEEHATHEQKHKKQERPRQDGTFDRHGTYHPPESQYDDF